MSSSRKTTAVENASPPVGADAQWDDALAGCEAFKKFMDYATSSSGYASILALYSQASAMKAELATVRAEQMKSVELFGETYASFKTSIANLEATVIEKDKAAEAYHSRIATLQGEVATLKSSCADKDNQLKQRDADIAKASKDLGKLAQRLKESEEKLASKAKEITECREHIATLQVSDKSWKEGHSKLSSDLVAVQTDLGRLRRFKGTLFTTDALIMWVADVSDVILTNDRAGRLAWPSYGTRS